jgi:hypothetical protein
MFYHAERANADERLETGLRRIAAGGPSYSCAYARAPVNPWPQPAPLPAAVTLRARAPASRMIPALRQQWRRGLLRGEGKAKGARVWAVSPQGTA